ncbi:hypothetical protein F4680DRAFT_450273 [Xylaria scruposa]|nr:hypothetical protein F4680DRAFT_450273 [Xylaria scruposa]
MPSITQGISTFEFARNLVFSLVSTVSVLALVWVITYKQLSDTRERLKNAKLEPTYKPKTWRLFIDLTGDELYPLTDLALQTALKAQLDIDLNGSRLGLVTLNSGRYCATLSLKPMRDPFTSGQQFILDIDSDSDQKTTATVTPDDNFSLMTTLYDRTDGKTNAVDLIVVSGLSSHPYGSFKSPKNAAENWLRDYLPKDLPNARILVYGYDSDIRNRKGKESISDFSITFLDAIYSSRKSDQIEQRPIIFIGHSLGGLVIKQALVHAHIKKTPRDELFLKTCYGFLFFGVPNRGLRNENLEIILGHSPTTQLVTDLVVDSDAEVKPYLKALGDSFINLFRDKGLDIVAFYEQYKSPTVVKQGESLVRTGEERLLVTQDSATMIDGNLRFGEAFPLPADHSMMVKYHTEHDRLYRMVIPHFIKMAERAPKVVKENLSHMHELSQIQIQRLNQLRLNASIEPINSSVANRPNDITSRCDGTLEWFLEETVFKEWRDARTACPLWVCGPPGQGKSVLAKFLTGHLEDFAKDAEDTNETIIVISFFCNAQIPENNQAIKILHGLLLQIIRCKEDYEYIDKISLESFSNSSFDQLLGFFSAIMQRSNKRRVYCIIDALDECLGTTRLGDKYNKNKTDRSTLINELINLSSQTKYQLRLLVTSRPGETDIKDCLNSYRYDLKANHYDLVRFVSSNLTNLDGIDNTSKQRIIYQISARAGDTFLWASMVVQELNELAMITVKAVNNTLKSIPKELDKMYRELIKRLVSRSSDYGKILAWVAYAKRPLTILELLNALKFDPHNEHGPYTRLSDMEEYEPLIDKDWIKTRLGNFLSIRQLKNDFNFYRRMSAEDQEPLEFIFFRHQAIKDFFDASKRDDVAKFLLGGSDPDLYLACTCVSYLNATGWQEQSFWLMQSTSWKRDYHPLNNIYEFMQDPFGTFIELWKQKTNSSRPLFFLHYAITSWHRHLETREQAEHKDIKASITKLLHEDGPFIRILDFQVKARNPPEMPLGTGSWPDGSLLGDIAIHLEIQWLMEQILDDRVASQSVSFVRLACNNPPLFGSLFAERKEQVSQMLPPDFLLQIIRSPNALSGVYSVLKNIPDKDAMITEEVLEAAASHKELHVIEQLLESGAAIKITDNCLRKAAQNQNPKVIGLLLQHKTIDATFASQLVGVAASCYDTNGSLQVLLGMYGDRIGITEEHLISTNCFWNYNALRTLLNHMPLTEASILCILKYYQSLEGHRGRFPDDRILQKLFSSHVRIEIDDDTAEVAARYVPQSSEMDCILELRASELPISESMVAAAAGNKECGKEILELFVRRNESDRVKLTEKALLALLSNEGKGREILAWIVESSLLPDPDAITFPVVSSAIYNPIPGASILKVMIQKGLTFEATEDMIEAAANFWLHSYQNFVQNNLCHTSWRIHHTTRDLLSSLLGISNVGLQQERILRFILGEYCEG